jgi:hypothetical protein
MRKLFLLLPLVLLLGCASSTYIRTVPTGAKVLEGETLKGVTPYFHYDRDPGPASRTFRITMDGYKEQTVNIKKTEFYAHRLIAPPVIGLPWTYGYPNEYVFVMEEDKDYKGPRVKKENIPLSANAGKTSDLNVRKLEELKKLKDEGLLTEQEYEAKKKEVLEMM